ncbi:MAG: transposase [Deltaproteobacteria bacterium]|nr:transposase [Deltaproteobacteria bacterium]
MEQTDDAQTLMQLASVSGRVALGTRAGRRPRALMGPPGSQWRPPKRCAQSGYYSLHAGVRLAARDRNALERLCRYILRPPLSHSRLSERDDGNLVLRLKTPWRNGTTAIVLSPSELLQRLAAIIPRPRVHQLTYHGVLAFGEPGGERRGPVRPACGDSNRTHEPNCVFAESVFGQRTARSASRLLKSTTSIISG